MFNIKKILVEKKVINLKNPDISKKSKIQPIFNIINITNINKDIIIQTNFQIIHMIIVIKIIHFLKRTPKHLSRIQKKI